MAKRRPAGRTKSTRSTRKRSVARRSGRRPTKKTTPRPKVTASKKARASRKSPKNPKRPKMAVARKAPALDRARRTLDETVPTPPSSLDLSRRASAARSGRAELAERRREHQGMSPAVTGGDVDVDVEDAYFTGDGAPGGDNPTPDQDVVDDIGKALGVQYEDNEELKASDKVIERDRHRWELDPASSEDYKERKKI